MSLLVSPPADHLVLRLDDVEAVDLAEAARVGDAPPRAVTEELPRVVAGGGFTDALEDLLLAVASGDREAFVALEDRVGGLVRVNILRVLRDAVRSEAVTQQFFAEVLRDAVEFDPERDSAEAWLLTRAHQRAMDGFAADTPQFVNGPTSTPRSPDPAVGLGHELLGAHPVQVAPAGEPEVSGGPTVLLHL